jgi:hypothetical protein
MKSCVVAWSEMLKDHHPFGTPLTVNFTLLFSHRAIHIS